MTSLSLVTLAG
ncbi:hypothetical protein YPPY15_2696, partial [Yersinia pestis PY-15]